MTHNLIVGFMEGNLVRHIAVVSAERAGSFLAEDVVVEGLPAMICDQIFWGWEGEGEIQNQDTSPERLFGPGDLILHSTLPEADTNQRLQELQEEVERLRSDPRLDLSARDLSLAASVLCYRNSIYPDVAAKLGRASNALYHREASA